MSTDKEDTPETTDSVYFAGPSPSIEVGDPVVINEKIIDFGASGYVKGTFDLSNLAPDKHYLALQWLGKMGVRVVESSPANKSPKLEETKPVKKPWWRW